MINVLDLAEKPEVREISYGEYDFDLQIRKGDIVSTTWMTKPTRVNNQPVDEQTSSD